jgi:hypothetical protein
MKKINAITPAALQKTAQKIFVNKGLNFAAIGRCKDAEFKKIFKA